ncbi:MAG TPA: hypothetical protein VK196_13945 [Magnetospirillum sp.]|nr:hypothetical protein [Magnetospirillum sp.]
MKMLLSAAVALVALASLPALAQSESSDRYTRSPAEADASRQDQQAQRHDRRHAGEVETLRRDHMNSPNIKGERVPENTETGAAAPELRDQPKQTEGGIRP